MASLEILLDLDFSLSAHTDADKEIYLRNDWEYQ